MMPRLIVLNGMPAAGKTTLGRRYAADHPFALVLELDVIRRLLGGWRDGPTRAGLLARAMSVGMARDHLCSGYDVVVPQFLGRPQFLEQLEEVAYAGDGRFFEFVLSDNRDELLRRFRARTVAAAEPAHVDAAWLIQQSGGDATFMTMYDRLLQLISTRPNTRVLQNPQGAQDATYADLIETIEARPVS